jgi:hypothetical protein
MKRIFLILPLILLTGCVATVPVKRNFPEVPSELMNACPALKTVAPGTEQLSKVIGVVADNYAQYHECKIKVDGWVEWYNAQKKIFDDVK